MSARTHGNFCFSLSEVQFKMETHAHTCALQFLSLSFYLLFTIKTGTCTHARKVPLDAGWEEHVANKHHTCSAVISSLFTPCVRHTSPSRSLLALLLQTAIPILFFFFYLQISNLLNTLNPVVVSVGVLHPFKGTVLVRTGFAELCWLWQKWSCWQMFNGKISTALTLSMVV